MSPQQHSNKASLKQEEKTEESLDEDPLPGKMVVSYPPLEAVQTSELEGFGSSLNNVLETIEEPSAYEGPWPSPLPLPTISTTLAPLDEVNSQELEFQGLEKKNNNHDDGGDVEAPTRIITINLKEEGIKSDLNGLEGEVLSKQTTRPTNSKPPSVVAVQKKSTSWRFRKQSRGLVRRSMPGAEAVHGIDPASGGGTIVLGGTSTSRLTTTTSSKDPKSHLLLQATPVDEQTDPPQPCIAHDISKAWSRKWLWIGGVSIALVAALIGFAVAIIMCRKGYL